MMCDMDPSARRRRSDDDALRAKPRPTITAACSAAVIAVGLAGIAQAEQHEFELNAPGAHNVYLAGEMTQWDKGKVPMRRETDGKWRVTVDLGRGEWLYKFIVDDKWIADPESPAHDADGQGGQHSFLFVGAGDWEELPGVPKGRVETLMLESKAWGKSLKLNVYLPPDFATGKRYPVLWLLHGSNMDADQWLKTGEVNRYMDNLIGRRAIHPFVIVMPSSESVPYTGKSERFITQELRAWLAKTYGLETNRAESAVAGMSMGGFGAFDLPLRHPDLYGFSFALSGYFSDDYIAKLPYANKLPMQAILLCGSNDDLVGTNRRLVRALHERKLEFYYREDVGAHTWQYWSNRMVEMLTAVDKFFAAEQVAAKSVR
jgi:enterochelin esterase-like enzyme